MTVTDGKFSTIVTVAVELSSDDTGSLTFVVTDDTGEKVQNAEITIISKTASIQKVDGVETAYYENYYGKTDANGIYTFKEKPVGEYSYTIQARGKKRMDGDTRVMPVTEGVTEQITMTTEPVSVEWTVVPTTIEDKYDIKMELTFATNIPTPTFGCVPPFVTIPKQITDPIVLETTIVNTGLVALTDVVADIKTMGEQSPRVKAILPKPLFRII